MNIDAQLRVGGMWLAAAGLPYGDLSWTDRADGGNFEATWSMTLDYGERPASVFLGADVEIYLGPSRRWVGQVSVTDWNGGTFTAAGISQRAYDFAAQTLTGPPTSIPDVAIATGVFADGWGIEQVDSFSAIPVVTDNALETFSNIGAVLDQAAKNLGVRWGVWGDGILRTYSDPLEPDYFVAPGVIELGETNEETFTAVQYAYLLAPDGVRSFGGGGVVTGSHSFEDFTNLGPISTATAAAIAQNLLSAGNSSLGWTGGVEVSSAQLLTRAGRPAELAAVTAGQVIRASVIGDQGQGFRDLVIGETKYAAGDDVLSMSPVGTVAVSLSDVIENIYIRVTGLPVGN